MLSEFRTCSRPLIQPEVRAKRGWELELMRVQTLALVWYGTRLHSHRLSCALIDFERAQIFRESRCEVDWLSSVDESQLSSSFGPGWIMNLTSLSNEFWFWSSQPTRAKLLCCVDGHNNHKTTPIRTTDNIILANSNPKWFKTSPSISHRLILDKYLFSIYVRSPKKTDQCNRKINA